jgi:hypothetical protein
MPHLVFHMSIARELAGTLKSPIIDSERGAYYMGATGPDMHVLDGSRRRATHFFDLGCIEEQDCVGAFFESYPELRDAKALSPRTAAFVAGYLSHLVVDELWITDVYRPFFGSQSSLGGDAQANVIDRVLQYDMDLERQRDREATAEIRAALLADPVDVEAGFVDNAALRRWRDVAADLLARPPTWDFFRYLAGRFLRTAGVETEQELEEFLKTVPDLLRRAREQVSDEQMRIAVDRMMTLSLRTLRDYLE